MARPRSGAGLSVTASRVGTRDRAWDTQVRLLHQTDNLNKAEVIAPRGAVRKDRDRKRGPGQRRRAGTDAAPQGRRGRGRLGPKAR